MKCLCIGHGHPDGKERSLEYEDFCCWRRALFIVRFLECTIPKFYLETQGLTVTTVLIWLRDKDEVSEQQRLSGQ